MGLLNYCLFYLLALGGRSVSKLQADIAIACKLPVILSTMTSHMRIKRGSDVGPYPLHDGKILFIEASAEEKVRCHGHGHGHG